MKSKGMRGGAYTLSPMTPAYADLFANDSMMLAVPWAPHQSGRWSAWMRQELAMVMPHVQGSSSPQSHVSNHIGRPVAVATMVSAR